jgi:hypothetical protein
MKQANKTISLLIAPQAIVNGAAISATNYVDTAGYNYAQIALLLGATDIAMSLCRVTECDTYNGSYTAITGLTFGTSTGSAGSATALPAATADNTLRLFNIDLKGRMRFLRLEATAGSGSAGTYSAAIAILGKDDVAPSTDAGQVGAASSGSAPFAAALGGWLAPAEAGVTLQTPAFGTV